MEPENSASEEEYPDSKVVRTAVNEKGTSKFSDLDFNDLKDEDSSPDEAVPEPVSEIAVKGLSMVKEKKKVDSDAGWFTSVIKSISVSEPAKGEAFELSELEQNFSQEEKDQAQTIILLGQTGVGKTTLINSMANFLSGVRFESLKRVVFIKNETREVQSKSQTKDLMIYYAKDSKGKMWRFVDTPGFGDTDDNMMDLKIVGMVSNCLEDVVTKVRAIFFVMKSSETRNTSSQKFIFNKVFELFGKDIFNNIYFVLTHKVGDGSDALEVLGQVTREYSWYNLKKTVMVNNGYNFEDPRKSPNLIKNYADAVAIYQNLFGQLSCLPDVSTGSSREVLKERRFLDSNLILLKASLDSCVNQMVGIKVNIEKLIRCENVMTLNNDSEIEVMVPKLEKIDTHSNVTNCRKCCSSCHINCFVPETKNKRLCNAMGSNGFCVKCKDKCIWSEHDNDHFIWNQVMVKEIKTIKSMKEQYSSAQQDAKNVDDIIRGMLRSLSKEFEKGYLLIGQIIASHRKLEKTALMPQKFDSRAFVKKLIDDEKRKSATNFAIRVSALSEYLRNIDLLESSPTYKSAHNMSDRFIRETFQNESLDKILPHLKALEEEFCKSEFFTSQMFFE